MCVELIRKDHTLTLDRLKLLLTYDPITGFFTWQKNDAVSRRVRGKRCNTVGNKGYILIQIDRKQYTGQRLAWFWMTGEWSEWLIDHEDGVKDNNIWTNLREATNTKNNQNLKAPKSSNKSGYLGVFITKSGKALASLSHEGKTVRIGQFDCPKIAHEAYLAKKRELHEGCTI